MGDEKKKSFWDKLNAGWQWLEGKKRRIALLSAVVMKVTKPYTVANNIAEISFYLFGGADILDFTSKEVIQRKEAVRKNPPSGLSKDNKSDINWSAVFKKKR